jgi:hypothetical protein
VLAYRSQIEKQTNNTFDKTRILGIVAAAKGAEFFLPHTIPKLIEQVKEIEIGLDLIIGLNNGFECCSVTDRLAKLPDCRIIHLYTEQRSNNTKAAVIYDNIQLTGKPYRLSNITREKERHRIFVVHQPQGIYSAGKIRMLGDIYLSMILKSIEFGWIPPEIQISFDAESLFLSIQENNKPQLNSNGLKLLFREIQARSKLDILGTTLKNSIYKKTNLEGLPILVPDLNEQISDIPWFLNLVHGQFPGYLWHPGGGTIGKTKIIVSILAAIAEKYPGARVEDVQMSILAQHSDFVSDISSEVISTNRVFLLTEVTQTEKVQPIWLEQIYRWMAGCHALELYYGKHNIKAIFNTGFAWMNWLDTIRFCKRVIKNERITDFPMLARTIKRLAIAYLSSLEIKKKVLAEPDLLIGSEVKASW